MSLTAEYDAQLLKDRVINGMAFLDGHEPNWRNAISVADLAMEDGEFCVLGQWWNRNREYSGDMAYYRARNEFSGHVDEAFAFNWAMCHGFAADDHRYSHRELTEAWQRALS